MDVEEGDYIQGAHDKHVDTFKKKVSHMSNATDLNTAYA